MALRLALTLFQHLIDGFHNRDLRGLVGDLLGVTSEQYTASQMTYDAPPRGQIPAASESMYLKEPPQL